MNIDRCFVCNCMLDTATTATTAVKCSLCLNVDRKFVACASCADVAKGRHSQEYNHPLMAPITCDFKKSPSAEPKFKTLPHELTPSQMLDHRELVLIGRERELIERERELTKR